MTDPKAFYPNYIYDYHVYKVTSLEAMLTNVKEFERGYLSSHIKGFVAEDFQRFVKAEIRMTCFHAIETLFELIFALVPNGGQMRDRDLWRALSTSSFKANYERIRQICEQEDGLNFLDQTINLPSMEDYPLWVHIFYFSHNYKTSQVFKELNESDVAIRIFLKAIAAIFNDRNEYNAYKHGIRALNTMQEFAMADPDGTNPISFDLKDSVSFFAIEKDENEVRHETLNIRVFNTQRDIQVTLLCAQMIANIILRRKWYFCPELRTGQPETIIFKEDVIKDALRSGIRGGMTVEKLQIKWQSA